MVDRNEPKSGKQKPSVPVLSSPALFFHSITGEPLLPRDGDPDSEDEDRDSWFQQSELADIDDYVDLEQKDKAFFKEITRSIRKNMNGSDIQMKQVLISFAQSHKITLKPFKMYLTLLFQKNVLSGNDAYQVLLELRKAKGSG